MRWRGSAAIVNDRPSSRERECYIRTMTAGVQLRKNILAVESQGARGQDELIGGKPPVAK
jgi:hypothetical protein